MSVGVDGGSFNAAELGSAVAAGLSGHVNISLDAQLTAATQEFMTVASKMASGTNLGKYFDTVDGLAARLAETLRSCSKEMNATNGTELVRTFNALNAAAKGDDLTRYFESIKGGYEGVVKAVETAKTRFTQAELGFTKADFTMMFRSADQLKAFGINVDDIIRDFAKGAGSLNEVKSTMQKALDDMAKSMEDNTRKYEEALQAQSEASAKLIAEKQAEVDKLKEINQDRERSIEHMRSRLEEGYEKETKADNWDAWIEHQKQIFSDYLELKQLALGYTSGWGGGTQELISPVDNGLNDYFQKVAEGSWSANDAITQLKANMPHLFEGLSDGEQAEAQLKQTEDAIRRIDSALEELRNGGFFNGGSGIVQNVVGDGSAAQTVNTTATAVSGLVEPLKELAAVGVEPLNSLAAVLKSLASTSNFTLDTKQITNLIEGLTKLGSVPDLGKLSALTSISLAGFNGVSVSKAALNNLATYLPEIAKADLTKLKELSTINLSGFSDLHLTKANSENIKNLLSQFMPQQPQDAFAQYDYSAGEQAAQVIDHVEQELKDEQAAFEGTSASAKEHAELLRAAAEAEKAKAEMSKNVADNVNTEAESLDGASDSAKKHKDKLEALQRVLTQITNAEKQAEASAAKLLKTPGGSDTKEYKELLDIIEKLHNMRIDDPEQWLKDGGKVKDLSNALTELKLRFAEADEGAKAFETQFRQGGKAAEQAAEAYTKISESIAKLSEQSIAKIDTAPFERMRELMRILRDENAAPDTKAAAWREFQQIAAQTEMTVRQLSEAEREEAKAAKEAEAAAKAEESEKLKQMDSLKQLTDIIIQATKAREELAKSRNPDASGLVQDLDLIIHDAQNARDAIGSIGSGGATAAIKELRGRLSEVREGMTNLGSATKQLESPFRMLEDRMVRAVSLGAMLLKGIQQLKKMVQEVVKLDTSMTQLRIVTDNSEQEYADYMNRTMQTAKDLGAAVTDLVDSTTTYARLGYTLAESSELSRVTAMLKNVGDIDIQTAQDAITVMTKAFDDVDAENIERVMDKMVVVGKEIAQGCGNAA